MYVPSTTKSEAQIVLTKCFYGWIYSHLLLDFITDTLFRCGIQQVSKKIPFNIQKFESLVPCCEMVCVYVGLDVRGDGNQEQAPSEAQSWAITHSYYHVNLSRGESMLKDVFWVAHGNKSQQIG